jgi:hypothetical protein
MKQNYGFSHLEGLMNQTYNQMYKEMLKNQTRIFGDLTQSEINNIQANGGLEYMLNDFIIKTTSLIGTNGQGSLEVLQGDPKLTIYLETIERA